MDLLEKKLNIAPQESNLIPVELESKEIADYQTVMSTAQKEIIDLAEIAKEAVNDFSLVAKSSQHHKDYDTLSNLVKTAVLAYKEVSNISKEREEIKKPKFEDKSITNQTLVLTTADLLKMIKDVQSP